MGWDTCNGWRRYVGFPAGHEQMTWGPSRNIPNFSGHSQFKMTKLLDKQFCYKNYDVISCWAGLDYCFSGMLACLFEQRIFCYQHGLCKIGTLCVPFSVWETEGLYGVGAMVSWDTRDWQSSGGECSMHNFLRDQAHEIFLGRDEGLGELKSQRAEEPKSWSQNV